MGARCFTYLRQETQQEPKQNECNGAPTKFDLPLGCLNGEALQAVDSGVEISRQMSISRLEVIFINWFPKNICSLKTILLVIHKKGRHKVACAGRNLALRLHSSGRLSPFVAVGKRCLFPLNKPASLQIVFCKWSTTI